MPRRVFVVAAGSSRFGERWEAGQAELAKEAWQDAGFRGKIDSLFVSSMASGAFTEQEHLGPLVLSAIGSGSVPSVRLEAACASGGAAVRQAFLSVRSGEHDVVAVVGLEKMTDVPPDEASRILSQASLAEDEARTGATFPALYALMARRHMHEFGTTEEQLAAVSAKNHSNACLNDKAHFRRTVSVDDVMRSPPVSDPLKVLDCSPVSDGAAAIIIAEEGVARGLSENPAEILACEQASGPLGLCARTTICGIPAAASAAKLALEKSGAKLSGIDLAEVHDCFTIAEIMALEDVGFFPRGGAAKATERGETALSGSVPVNPSGGLKAKGHPVGATGVSQFAECFLQLSGRAGKRQVKGARTALTHNVGGSGATAVIGILSGEVGRK